MNRRNLYAYKKCFPACINLNPALAFIINSILTFEWLRFYIPPLRHNPQRMAGMKQLKDYRDIIVQP